MAVLTGPILNGRASSVTLQAESGTLGADWAVSNSSSPAYITILSNGSGSNPGSAAPVATYTVTFPAPDTYQLYARLRVGPSGYDDDSLFYANGFGVKSPSNNSDWILVNGLAGAGFNNSTDVVTGGGSLGSGVWKWVNLLQFTGQSGFTVNEANLTQTFQIGARENGLDLDKFVFGTAGYTFTVADLDAGGPGTPPPPPAATIDSTTTYQTIEGFGGAIAFYNGWVTAHPYKQEIYTNAFAGLNLSMLRLGNWFRYTNSPDYAAFEIVSNANRVLGRPVEIMMSSWSPPASLKSNGQVGNGGTLLYTNGGFAYTEFAKYWYDSLLAYGSNGVSPTWISIQNEPDWEAGYDSCIFRPTEGLYNGTNWAGYSNALSAIYLKVASLPSPPKFLGPEPVGIGYNVPQNYAATMNPDHFYGFCYHLYHGGSGGTADGYISSFRATTNLFPTKPRFMTEYGVSNMIESATLIHNALTEGLVSGYNFWSLVWPWDGLGLVQIEFPWDQSRWTNAPPGTPTQSRGYWLSPAYWSMKHYSYYITPGSRRVAATCNNSNVRVSAFVTPDNLRLVAVLINRSASPLAVDLNFGSFPFNTSSVYQTAGTNKFQPLGPVGSQLMLPAESLTTVVLDDLVSSESPLLNVSATPTSLTLIWPLASAGFTLQSHTNLVTGNWVDVTSPAPQIIGGQWQVILPVSAISPATFYRLVK